VTDRILNLTFHGLGEPGPRVDREEVPYWVSAAMFERTLDAVRGRGDVAVSFDDGNESDVRIALPLLAARGMTASFFVVADRIDAPGYLGTAAIRELVAAGMPVGSHGFSHHSWRGLSADGLRREVFDARDRIAEATERPVTGAACPFGTYDRRALGALRAAGFELVLTSDRWYAERGAWLQPRFTIVRDDTPASLAALLGSRPGVVGAAVAAARLAVKRWR
jgi:peptidoglycan/xylan/chitin deacetylase (PgdA/CDA1 family)